MTVYRLSHLASTLSFYKPKFGSKRDDGFTLVEFLIGAAIVSILLGVVGPSASNIVKKSRIMSDFNRVSAVVRFARTTAISKIETVTLCPSVTFEQCDSSWAYGLMVFVDKNHNLQRDENEAILAATQALSVHHKMKGPSNPIRYYETGRNASPASLTLCPRDNDAHYARALIISLQGRTRLSSDSNQDGIHERTQGQNINCAEF